MPCRYKDKVDFWSKNMCKPLLKKVRVTQFMLHDSYFMLHHYFVMRPLQRGGMQHVHVTKCICDEASCITRAHVMFHDV